MNIPFTRKENDSAPIAWWEWLLSPIVLPVIIVLFGIAAVVSVPVAMYSVVALKCEYRRLLRRMKEKGRYIDWDQLQPRLLLGEGTIIVEQAQKQGHRIWWTDDRLTDTSPYPIPQEETLSYFKLKTPDPFVLWCFENHLDQNSGRAFLTDPPYDYPDGFIERSYFSEKFPRLNVVMTVKLA